MIQLRSIAAFCRAKAYIQRFQNLESQVNRLEIDVIQKKQYLQEIKRLKEVTSKDLLKKYLGLLFNNPYQSSVIKQERQKLKKMQKQLTQLEEEGKSRSAIAQRMKKQEQLLRQNIFLADLTRFSHKYKSLLSLKGLDNQIFTGIELSNKVLSKILQKQGVEQIQQKFIEFNPEIHERVGGQGKIVKQIQQTGFKIKGTVIAKSKVILKD